MKNPDRIRTTTYKNSDMMWLMIWDSKREKKQQAKFSPKALQDEETREKAADTIAEMMKNIVEEGEQDD